MTTMFKKRAKKFQERTKLKSESDEEDTSGGKQKEIADDEESRDSVDVSSLKKEKKKKKDKSVAPPAASLLSFDHDEGEGEVFKVKKSSYSRKIAKQLKKESKKEKENSDKKAEDGNERQKQPSKSNLNGAKNEDATSMEVDSGSDNSSDENRGKPSHSFRDILARGVIPDANLIHLARKKRQMAREAGDFIPIDDTKRVENNKSRLIREDDNDLSDDENKRIDFSLNNEARDRQELRDRFLAMEHGSGSEGSDQEREWEEQQIRKGVSIPQVQNVQQTSEEYNLFQHKFYEQQTGVGSPSMGQYSSQRPNDSTGLRSLTRNLENLTVDSIRKRLHDRLSDLEQVHRAHVNEKTTLVDNTEQTEASIVKLEGSKGGLEEQYKFFQQMRGYVRDLVECLNEKVPKIDELERSMLNSLKQRADKFVRRRQEDIKDQSTDAMMAGKQVVVTDPVKQRRVAEREARRSRRRRAREGKDSHRDHNDGLSSDDEENQSDIVKFNTERERILGESSRLFEDVIEEFCEFSHVKSRFEHWKFEYGESYREAYIGLCLPKLCTPLIRLQLLDWNPLQSGCKHFESMDWYECLLFFGFKPGDEPEDGDDDITLMSSIVEKVVLPKLTSLVENVWDPVSSTQSDNLVELIEMLFEEYPTVTGDNKNSQALLKAVVVRMQKMLDDDVFMPLYPKQMIDNKSSLPFQFLHRQFWYCTKLLNNLLKWHNLIAQKSLQELTLDGILNRYIMLALRTLDINGALVKKYQAVTASIPKHWFSKLEGDNTLPQLEMMCAGLLNTANILDRNSMGCKDFEQRANRENMKQITKVLVNIHAMNHAMTMANMFSLKI